jgi:hypothetical protein
MIDVQIEQPDGTYIVDDAARIPKCGEDFCDRCGDCLACESDTCWYGGYDNGPHLWVIDLPR